MCQGKVVRNPWWSHMDQEDPRNGLLECKCFCYWAVYLTPRFVLVFTSIDIPFLPSMLKICLGAVCYEALDVKLFGNAHAICGLEQKEPKQSIGSLAAVNHSNTNQIWLYCELMYMEKGQLAFSSKCVTLPCGVT